MTTIREILDHLKPEERSALNYAFEHGLTHYILLDNDRFVGVNTDKINFLQSDLEMQRGNWRVGNVRKPK